jgi:hypothetical protein
VFYSSHLDFLAMLSIETLLSIHVVSLLIEQQPILKIKYINNFFLFDLMRVATLDLVLALTLRGCDLDYFTHMINFDF